MPEIKFQHIVSFSSEDKVHKAENLLRPDTFRKWKCLTPGEKQACVVIQLEKSTMIHSIDIGNENSAFVEILVGRSVDPAQDFKVLLVASSFMSPMESKNGNNINRVRMFGVEKLSPAATEKWDLVKIVCTQPFNKSTQYGLSFIKLHSPPSPIIDKDKIPTKAIGTFSIKEEDDSDLNVGSWFAKRKEMQASVSTAAAIRDASSLASVVLEQSAKLSKSLTPPKPFAKQNEANELLIKMEKKEKVQLDNDQNGGTVSKEPLSNKMTPSRKRKDEGADLKPKGNAPKKAKRAPKVKQFDKLMENVTFVLSGFQNPYRSELRDKAVKMGAHYKGDWDKRCTHLVCAFVNTPKYTQVRKAGGRVVTKDWIIDCYSKKSLLPWRDYMLGKYQKESTTEGSEAESDSDLPQKRNIVKKHEHTITQSSKLDIAENYKGNTSNNAEENSIKDTSESHVDLVKSEDEYAASTDIDESNSSDNESERDTEELRKAQCTIDAAKNSRDEIEQCRPDTTELPLPELPEFFKNKCFFLYGNFSSEEVHNLKRYIIAFHGSISSYMDDKVNFVITKETWDDRFNDALEENDELIFVKPQWIYECKEKSKLIPYQRFVVVPSS